MFLTYLDNLEKSVNDRKDVKKHKELMLAKETRKGLRFTGMCHVLLNVHSS